MRTPQTRMRKERCRHKENGQFALVRLEDAPRLLS